MRQPLPLFGRDEGAIQLVVINGTRICAVKAGVGAIPKSRR